MITREYLEGQIQELTATRDRLQRDVYANNGAVQFCQHLLAILELEAKAEEEAIEGAEAEGLVEGAHEAFEPEEPEGAKSNGEATAP